MSIEKIFGLEDVFWPVDNSAQIEQERKEYYLEQDDISSQLKQLKQSSSFPKLQQNYLDDVLDDSGLQWLYNGTWNSKRTDLNILLNPEEIVKLYVGVWRYKELRDHREITFVRHSFDELIPYLIGLGKNSLGGKHLKKSEVEYAFNGSEYSSPIEERLAQLPDGQKIEFIDSMREKVKIPGKDFFKPKSRIKPGLDATARRVYLKEVIVNLYD